MPRVLQAPATSLTAIPTSIPARTFTNTVTTPTNLVHASTNVSQASPPYSNSTIATIASAIFSALFIITGALITGFIVYQYYKYGIKDSIRNQEDGLDDPDHNPPPFLSVPIGDLRLTDKAAIGVSPSHPSPMWFDSVSHTKSRYTWPFDYNASDPASLATLDTTFQRVDNNTTKMVSTQQSPLLGLSKRSDGPSNSREVIGERETAERKRKIWRKNEAVKLGGSFYLVSASSSVSTGLKEIVLEMGGFG
ncbi:hypothetical protein BC937DRAFT_92441 [Endogone sp. FLAS-F59071]|nr:hypothetical protein BC937DRAFT_92441 [Endogone sp. FLAS-F59071]|eukprot:RUS15440.1 hypothetical protein BC937DRAFT_92441 [Endogone sp. FLAS-F59071]